MQKQLFRLGSYGLFLLLLAITFFPQTADGQVDSLGEPIFSGVKIYAIPFTSRTRRPLSEQDVIQHYDILISVRDEYLPDDILSYVDSLETRPPIKYENVRIVCEVYREESLDAKVNVHFGGIISMKGTYYQPFAKLLDLIFYYLPEEYK
ncbi:MAG: hypothetical protein AAFV78_11490 [Bacteroidota bacterium]